MSNRIGSRLAALQCTSQKLSGTTPVLSDVHIRGERTV